MLTTRARVGSADRGSTAPRAARGSPRGRTVELGPRKQRAVLAMLALEVGSHRLGGPSRRRAVGRGAAGQRAEDGQLYVSHLRRVLDGNGARIVTRGRGYELQLPDDDVDAVRFERLLDESRAREALALWRGERARRRRRRAVRGRRDPPARRAAPARQRVARSTPTWRSGRHAEVIGELETLVAAHPLRERLHAQRMLALYRSGRQSEALEAYREARSGLVEEIGVEPGAELQRLHERILAHDPPLDLPAPADAEPVTSPAAAPPAHRLLVGAAVLLLAGLTAFGVIRVLEPDGLPGIDENYVGLIDPDSGRITSRYPVGSSPSAVDGGGGSVWIANAADGTVSRIDRERDEAVRIPVGGARRRSRSAAARCGWPTAIARVVQVDPGTNKVVQRSRSATRRARWPPRRARSGWRRASTGRIQRIDLDRGRVGRPIRGGREPERDRGRRRRAVGGERGGRDGDARRAAERQRLPPIRVGNGPSALAVGEGAVWVINRHDGTLSRSTRSGTSSRGRSASAATRPPSPWARARSGSRRRGGHRRPRRPGRAARDRDAEDREQPGGDRGRRRIGVGGRGRAAGRASRRHAARLVPRAPGSPRPDGPAAPASPTPPGRTCRSARWPTTASSRTGASRAPPAPRSSARSPRRAGAERRREDLRLHAPPRAALLRRQAGPAEDFRASMERFLQVTRGAPAAVPGLLRGDRRRPAAACTGTAPCDLARGIETDAQARTVTIHLTRPRRGLPAQAHDVVRVRRARRQRSPRHDGSRRRPAPGPTASPPGTPAAAGRSSATATSGRARRARVGPGFADRIEVGLYDGADDRARRSPPSSAAPPTWRSSPTRSSAPLTADRIRALPPSRRAGSTAAPAPTTDWMFLNVRRRPFDDLRVRQAVNFAIDRARVVELTGRPGGRPARPASSCRPGSPATSPTARTPRSRRRPRLDRARHGAGAPARGGVRARRRARRRPHAGLQERALGRYYARLLDELGFRDDAAVSRLRTSYDIYEADTRAHDGPRPVGGRLPRGVDLHRAPLHVRRAVRAKRLAALRSRRSTAGSIARWPCAPRTRRGRLGRRRPPRRRPRAGGAADQPPRPRCSSPSGRATSGPTAQWFTLLDQMWVR